MLALIGAVLFILHAFGIDQFGDVAVFSLALAFWAAHFAFALPIPAIRRRSE